MAVHPGMMIKPELDERGISQKEFAKMLDTQPSHLSEVLNGKRSLTTELAVKIEKTIGLPAKILLAAQTQYELESTNISAPAEDNQHETIAVTIPIRDRNLLRTNSSASLAGLASFSSPHKHRRDSFCVLLLCQFLIKFK